MRNNVRPKPTFY